MRQRECELCNNWYIPRNNSQRRCNKKHYIICPNCGQKHELQHGASILPLEIRRNIIEDTDDYAVIEFNKSDIDNWTKTNLYHSRFGLLCDNCRQHECIICKEKFYPKNQSDCICDIHNHYYKCPHCGNLYRVKNSGDLPLEQYKSRKYIQYDTKLTIIEQKNNDIIFSYDLHNANASTYLTSLCNKCKEDPEIQKQWEITHTENLKEGRKKVTFGEGYCKICGNKFIRKSPKAEICDKNHYHVCPNCKKTSLVKKLSYFNSNIRDDIIFIVISSNENDVYFDYIYDNKNYDYIDSVCIDCKQNDPKMKKRFNYINTKRGRQTHKKRTGYNYYLESAEGRARMIENRKRNRAAKSDNEIEAIKRAQKLKTMKTNTERYGTPFFPNVPPQNKGFIRLKIILPDQKEAYVSSFWEAVVILFFIYIKQIKNIQYETLSIDYSYNNKNYTYIPDFLIGNTIYEVKGYEPDVNETIAKQHAAENNGYKFVLVNHELYANIENDVKNYGFNLEQMRYDAREAQTNGGVLVLDSLKLENYLK